MLQRLRVLLVDDSEADARLIERLLRQEWSDLDLQRVETRQAMEKALEEGVWDVVLSDQAMPRFDALKALRTLQDSGLDLPFIVTSNVIDMETAVSMKLMKSGTHDFVSKDDTARLAPAIMREIQEARVRGEKKAALDALQESEALQTAIVRSAHCGIIAVDGGGRVMVFNTVAEKLFGYTQEEMQEARGLDLIFPPEFHAAFLAGMKDFIRNGASEFFDKLTKLTVPQDTGVDLPLDIIVAATRSHDRCIFTAVIRDITQSQQAEEARRVSEERFRAILENVAVGTVVINETGIVEIFNAAAEKIFGYDRVEVVGQNIRMLMPEPYHSHHDSYLHHYVETGETKIIGTGREVVGLRKNGKEFPMQLGVGEIEIGNHRSFVGSVSDLTNLKALERRLLHSQRMEAVGELTGGVAHDFNNLLAIMIGNAELLQEAIGDQEEAKHSIEAIKAAVERGASLTSRLLAFSRRASLMPVTADVAGLVLNLEDMLRRTLGEAVALRVENASALWPAKIDPHQFENALVNLALNARDAMPNGGTLVIKAVNTTLDEIYAEENEEVTPGDYVEISVSDTGTGITPGVLEKVFEPFFTTKEIGEGSGLGLSMVFGFAKQSKGHVTISSEVGHGTTVTLFLPRSVEIPVAEEIPGTTRRSTPGSELILVVEDDKNVREIPVRLLRKLGYAVVEAGTGEEALRHLTGGRAVDLLFTDLVLPGGMNGVEIAEKAKQIEPGIKILFTSGYSEHTVVEQSLLKPGIPLLEKPYLPTKMLDMVRAILDDGDVVRG